MKKVMGSVLCTAVLAAAIGSVMLPVSAVEEKTNSVNVVTIGDSIARGHGCKAEEAYGYLLSQQLKTDLTSSGYTTKFVNYGHDGDTADEMLAKIDASSEMQDSIKNADVITMSIGGNHVIRGLYYEFAKAFDLNINSPTLEADIMNAFQTTPPLTLLTKLAPIMSIKPDVTAGTATPPERMRARADEYQKEMVKVFDRLYTLNSKATILLTTIPNPTKDPTIGRVLEYYMEMYNSYIRTECPKMKNKVLIADCSKTFNEYSGSEALSFTVIDWKDFSKFNLDPHPTPFGHTLMEQTHYALLSDFVTGLKEAAKTSTTASTTTTATTTSATSTTTTAASDTTTATTPSTTATTTNPVITTAAPTSGSETTAAPAAVYTIKGQLISNGKPLANTVVELHSAVQKTTTDANGYFTFTNVEAGTHTVDVLNADGTVAASMNIEIQKSDVSAPAMSGGVLSVPSSVSGISLKLNMDNGTLSVSDVKADVSNPVTGNTPVAAGSVVLLAAAVSTLIVTKKRK